VRRAAGRGVGAGALPLRRAAVNEYRRGNWHPSWHRTHYHKVVHGVTVMTRARQKAAEDPTSEYVAVQDETASRALQNRCTATVLTRQIQ
jgi:hypothetical protein